MTELKRLIASTTAAVDQMLDSYAAKRKRQDSDSKPKRLKLSRAQSEMRPKWGTPVLFEYPSENLKSPLTPLGQLEELKGITCLDCYEKSHKLSLANVELEEYREQNKELSQQLAKTSQHVSELRKQLQSEEGYRQALHRHLQSLRGNMRIYCRIKQSKNPFIELPDISPIKSLTIPGSAHSVYTFDRVFSGSATQVDVYSEIQPFIQSFVDGDDVCIFCYGQTGSGKTYTLEGPGFNGAINETVGVLPRAATDIFLALKAYKLTSITSVKLAAIEIYLDVLKDLLHEPNELKLKSNKDKTVVSGLSWHSVADAEGMLQLLSQAAQCRVRRGTAFNSLSSRSHCIYQVSLTRNSKISTLNIIDLAGSERSNPEPFRDKTRMQVEEMKQVQTEASSINKSLSCLRRVISALANKAPKTNMPPFRESKLTRLLQDNLSSAEAKVVLIVNICDTNDTETRESLKFSAAAQRC
eukprot:CAMPEP_0204903670 /NCGR_PEP_ID=MMETSP1397-20131031/4409_1 /ASSEMBLY_ACC=CAM_ASM_000891 /TAXON_ID=49980 /ORGANISM="Climacostomum Climacostomum virens, Strain Stock W-24" /LENGTH=468 /DNA_ID=CAMNT_0052072359 /DNA_START=1184 /DNA_END=2590 /DNA_ORIENTATION=+